MIKSYADGDTENVAKRVRVRKFQLDIQEKAQRKLMIIHNAGSLNDLRIPPGNRLEALSGNRSEQYSIRVNNRWRICFDWLDGDAYRVEIVDYH